jgi:hypothetical protein
LGVVSIVLAIAYSIGNLPNGQLLLVIILMTGIGFPIFIMCLMYVVWLFNHKARQRLFSKTPFNRIENIGFYKAYLHKCSKWALIEETKEGHLNGFTLRMNLSKEKGYYFIEFDIPLEWKKLEKSLYNSLTKKLKYHNAEFRIESIVKHYDTRQQILQTVSHLEQDLEYFTKILKQEGFEPKT